MLKVAVLRHACLVALCCATAFLSACDTSNKPTQETAPAQSTNTPPPADVTAEPAPPKRPSGPPPTGMADPFTYCDTVGTIDAPDNRYTGKPLPDNLIDAMMQETIIGDDIPNISEPGFITWRCADKQLLVCVGGATTLCDKKADTNNTPSEGMLAFCKTEADADEIPVDAMGVASVYSWSCEKGKPVMGEQIHEVDAQGYPEDFWSAVGPIDPNAPPTPTN